MSPTESMLEYLFATDSEYRLRELTYLSDEAAKTLSKISSRRTLDLSGLQTLSASTAAILGNSKAEALFLQGLSSLTIEVLQALASFKTDICLSITDHLPEGSEAVFETFQCRCLAIRNSILTVKSAVALSRYRGHLQCHDLGELQDEVLEILTGGNASEIELDLSSFRTLTTRQANALARKRGALSFTELFDLPLAAAQALTTNKYALYLPKLIDLSEPLARVLVKYSGLSIRLDGVRQVSDTVASIIAGFPGDIFLGFDSLQHESSGHLQLAEKISNQKTMNYPNLATVSTAVAKVLFKRNDPEWLSSITELPDGLESELIACRKRLPLNSLRNLSDEIADIIGRCNSFEVSLNGLKTLKESAARNLRPYRGALFLDGIKELSEALARVVSALECSSLSMAGVSQLTESKADALCQLEGYLRISGIKTLSDQVAATLAKHKQGISLDGLADLPDTAGHIALAKVLARVEGNNSVDRAKWTIFLDGLKRVSVACATELAQTEGNLSLLGIQSIDSIELAHAFSGHSNALALGLTSLREEVAAVLSQRKGALCLHSLQFISDRTAEILSNYKGHLALRLCQLPESAARILLEKCKSK